jgi:hypothetical protein
LNHGVRGDAAQLQKAGEMAIAPMRQRKSAVEISDPEENPMAPSQVMRVKTKVSVLFELLN